MLPDPGAQTPGSAYQSDEHEMTTKFFPFIFIMIIAGSGALAQTPADLENVADRAREAFRAADTGDQKTAYAHRIASARFHQERYFNAAYWLRIAHQHAKDEAVKVALAKKLAIVRAKNPTSISVGFSLAPNSNINSGSDSEFINLFGLPFRLSPDARALSGFEGTIDFTVNHKISEGAKHKTEIGFSGYGRFFKLSTEAEKAAPNVTGNDYSYLVLETYIRHAWLHDWASGPARVRLNFGKNWYGLKPYRNYLNFGVSQEWRPKSGYVYSIGIGHQQQITKFDNSLSTVHGLIAKLTTPTTKTGRFHFNLELEQTVSNVEINENRAARFKVNYSFAKPLIGAHISLGLRLEKTDWGKSPYDVDGRHDMLSVASINVALPRFSYYGFSPIVTLEGTQAKSNISLYDRKSFGLRVKFASVF